MKQTKTFIHWFSTTTLKFIGWQAEIHAPLPKKCIIIGAPHTSNWDLPIAFLLMGAKKIRFHWVGKKDIFRWPFGHFMKNLGGIPVDRKQRSNFVDQIVQKFKESNTLRIAIAPEGTRSKTSHWKTGFYYMALKAEVPILLGYIDAGKRKVGIGESFLPSGDIHADFEIIRKFYSDKVGFRAGQMGQITPLSTI